MYYILFTTTTCIKCPSFKKIVLEKINFNGRIIDENSEDFMNLASKYFVMSAPSFIVFNNEDLEKEIFRCSEECELEEFIRR